MEDVQTLGKQFQFLLTLSREKKNICGTLVSPKFYFSLVPIVGEAVGNVAHLGFDVFSGFRGRGFC